MRVKLPALLPVVVTALVPAASLLLPGCASKPLEPDLRVLYETPAQALGGARNPVVVIPGILGSKLEAADGTKVWGSFTFGAADADTPDGARLVALPMASDVPLVDLRDDVRATAVLDVVVADVTIFRGLEFAAYSDILTTLDAGAYRDQGLGESGAVDYGGLHYTCFQYPYDWRRDIAESAVELDAFIRDAQIAARVGNNLPDDAPVKVDVIAHSMGGLVLRYYLRYGTQPLPEDGSLPELTWAGAEHVANAVLIGTPNAGSILSLHQLAFGWNLKPLFPDYKAAVLGTMPAIYQLLPRTRHARVLDAATGEPLNIYDPAVWEKYNWGLANPHQDPKLRELLPEVASAEERRAIALDHLRKSLAKAEQLHRALDVPAQPPEGTRLLLFAGDAMPTDSAFAVNIDGTLRVTETEPGDNTVTRRSALMDERTGQVWQPRLQSPIAWHRTQFIAADHIGLTRQPSFADNLLYTLLEEPRGWSQQP
jgi:hypothetical protein